MIRYIAGIGVALILLGASFSTVGASTTRVPLQLSAVEASGGAVDLEWAGSHGQVLGFVPHGHFDLGLVLRNTSGVRLVVTNVRTIEPPWTLVHQTGSRFHHLLCSPALGGCSFPMVVHSGGRQTVTVRPGKAVGVELDFTLGSCAQISSANPAPLTRARITFRRPDQPPSHRTLSLGGAAMHLRMPKPVDCKGPHSSIKVDGEPIPFNLESSTDWTIPGSVGDVCAIRNGDLHFVSRKFQTDVLRPPFAPGDWERIRLRLDRFTGTSAYHRGTATLVQAGRELFHWRNMIVHVTRATPREVVATFHVRHRAVRGTMRCRIRG